FARALALACALVLTGRGPPARGLEGIRTASTGVVAFGSPEMLDREQRPSWSDRPQSAVDAPAPGLAGPAARRSWVATGALHSAPEGWRGALPQPRLAVGLVLITCGAVWAIARGLQFYGLGPASIAYDVDQPPLLLVLVGTWVAYRSRRR